METLTNALLADAFTRLGYRGEIVHPHGALVAGPGDIVLGRLDVRPTLDGIEDGLRDLIHYPYGCLEQTTSQVIPMIAVRDLAETLAIDGLTGPALFKFAPLLGQVAVRRLDRVAV